MRRPDVPHDWCPRRLGHAPAEYTRALARRYAHGGLLAELLWQRGVSDLETATAFLEPSLARGLRPPDPGGTLDVFAAALAKASSAGVAVIVGDGERLSTALAGAAVRLVLGGGGAPGTGAALLALEAGTWRLETPAGRALRTWRPSDADSGLHADCSEPAAALYLLARVRKAAEEGGRDRVDPRRALDVLALAVLAESERLSMREEHRTIAAVGLQGLGRRPGMRMLSESAQVPAHRSHGIRTRVVPRLDAAWRDGGLDALVRVLDVRDVEHGRRLVADVEMLFARRRRAESAAVSMCEHATPVVYDVELTLADLSPGLAMAVSRLEPYGLDNPEPVFLARGVRIDGAKLVGDPTRPYERLRLRQEGRTVRAVAAAATAPSDASPDQRFDVLVGVRAVEGGLETRVVCLRPTEVQGTENANKTIVS